MYLLWSRRSKSINKNDLKYLLKVLINEYLACHGYVSPKLAIMHQESSEVIELTINDRLLKGSDSNVESSSPIPLVNEEPPSTGQTDDDQPYIIEEKEGRNPGSSVFSCDICSKVFSKQRNLNNHSYLKKHISIHEDPSIICSVCGRCFKTQSEYNSHVRYAHDSNKNFVCEICGKGFNHKTKLNLHVKNNHVHSDINCEICGKRIPKKYRIKHLRVVHPGVKPEVHFDCAVCNKWFPTQFALNEHELSHLKTKDTQCHICLQYFTRLCIKSHIKKVHERSKPKVRSEPEKKFECDFMPMYEGLGLLSEKHAVVLDVGSAYTKLGYAGEYQPRKIIPSPKNLFKGNKISDNELYDEFVSFIHSLYFEHLLINPKDRRVVIVESVIGYARFRNIFARVLFKHFEVLSVLFAPSHLMPLFLLGIRSGLVLDVGYSEAELIPVYEGVPILKAWQALPLASEVVQKSLKNALDDQDDAISSWVIEDIAVRFCFVANYKRGQEIQNAKFEGKPFQKSIASNLTYPIKGNKVIQVSGDIRESVCEDNDRLSIPTMILDSHYLLFHRYQKTFSREYCVFGGCTQIPGFKSRVIKEIKDLCETEPHYRASIFGATDEVATRSLSRDAYLKEQIIPDWANLKFNLPESIK
ncbi:ACTR10 [Lepeophtheirus salmonis]|uniref:ACTR10 n=1 Tax=Lepeophtheirus salmonis TaxID=72036 RepID=A0A7R8D7T8_LEPSM|nr:ACTR10 [Lepeophtheirus salmonis]CAF3029888.1 ACTR10 [Lepeophtheirus salmonis]